MAEETGNNKTFKDLVAEQKRTTEEQKKTTTAIRHQMMTAEEIAEEESESRKKSEARIEGGRKSWETRQANLMAKNNPNSASSKEKRKEANTYLRDTFKYFLGKNSFFAKGFSSIGKSLKEKVGGGIDSIFKALKAGAFVLFLGAVVAFLKSDTFKKIKDKIIPFIVTGLETLKEWFLYIKDKIPDMVTAVKAMYHQITLAYQKFLQLVDTWLPILREKFQFLIDAVNDLIAYMETPEFKDIIKVLKKSIEILASGFGYMRMGVLGIYNTFWDDEGEFKGLEGLKEVFNRISIGFTNIVSRIKDAFYGSDGPAGQRGSEFSWTRGIDQIGVEIKNIAGAFGKVAGSLLFTLGLLAPKKFFGTAFWVARTVILGPTGKILKGFGKLALYLTGFGNSLDDVGNDMRKQNRNFDRNNKPGRRGRGGGIGGKFGKLFGFARSFGGLIAGVGIGMLAQLDLSKASGVLSDTAKGIGSAFKSLFSVVGDFATSIANVASKATAKVASVIANALSTIKNIGKTSIGTPQTKGGLTRKQFLEEIKAKRKLKPPNVQVDVDGLKKPPVNVDTPPKVIRSVNPIRARVPNPPPQLVVPKFNVSDLPNLPLTAKITKPIVAAAKVTVKQRVWRSLLKKIPIFGALASGLFAGGRVMAGDYTGALLELASGASSLFPGPGTAASFLIDAKLLARDLGITEKEALALIKAAGQGEKLSVIGPSGTYMDMNRINLKSSGYTRLGGAGGERLAGSLIPNTFPSLKPDGGRFTGGERRDRSDAVIGAGQELSALDAMAADFLTLKNIAIKNQAEILGITITESAKLRINPKFDKNEDGFLDADELRASKKAKGARSKPETPSNLMINAPMSTVNKSVFVANTDITDTSFGGVISAR